jgi:acetolactate synthase I/II/III large subunit
VRDALEIAGTGRPGPVLIDLPVDVASAPARDATHPPYLPGYRPRARPNGRQVRRAAEALAASVRPVLYVGGGAIDAADALAALAHACGAPVTTTLMALGAFPASDPQWLGMLGMHGTRPANWAMDEADLIVAVGARFDDRVTGALDEFAPRAKVVHVDIDATEIGKNVVAHIPIVGDAGLALAALLGAYERLDADRGRLAGWWARIRGWQAAHPPRAPEPADGCVAPEAALDALAARLGDAIVTTDVGQHQMWAAGRLRFERPRRWLTSGGLGTMGFGLPAALGAQAARPDATVVCVSGEGSFLMHVQELATAVEERLPVKVLLLDNASLGMVRQQQDLFWGGRRTAVSLGASPDWEPLARAFGVAARSVGDDDELPDAVAEMLAEPGPALLHVRIAPEANCLPMFRPGGAAREMIG